MTEFNKAAEQCIRESERTYPQFINGQLLAVASRALKATAAASKDRIAVEMGQVATSIKGRRIYRTDTASLAHRIINARRARAGLPLIWGNELDQAARKMVASRLRAVNFIRSGWIYAIRTLARAVGYRSEATDQSARMSGTPKGRAVPANRAFDSIVEGLVENTALLTVSKSGTQSNPMPVAQKGLQTAIDETRRDMLDHLAEKLRPIFKSHSA